MLYSVQVYTIYREFRMVKDNEYKDGNNIMTISGPLPDPVDPTQRMQESASCLHLAWLTLRNGELSETASPAIRQPQISSLAETVVSSFNLSSKTEVVNWRSRCKTLELMPFFSLDNHFMNVFLLLT